ncbi:alpha/beta hydrolase [Kribbella sp. NPDC048915]|uniref:alpha/beta fold hydrolase n=1 Tax=Kribbella sp. NPDC048915 TaxID=3155148 RepID=UPI0033DEAD2B
MPEFDVRLPDGRVLHAYDTGGDSRVAVVWHHGTPNLGTPPQPLSEASDRLGIRWISFDRPGYGGSTAAPYRTVASVAQDLTVLLDELGVGECAQVGYSGGGTFALGAAAVLGDRVPAVATFAAIAPYDAHGLDWYDGMIPSSRAALQAAAAGREAKVRHENSGAEYDFQFTASDLAMFEGPWGWLGSVAGNAAMPHGPDGLIDDDCSYTTPWGCTPASVTAPVLLNHGTADGIIPCTHAQWLAGQLPSATLRLHPELSHISVLSQAEPALERIREHFA